MQAIDRSYATVVGDEIIDTPFYDNRCMSLVSGGCKPIAVISAERFQEASTGPTEAAKIGRVLQGKRGISDYLIEEEAWDCIWEELIVHRKGVKTFMDREGLSTREYNFSEEMLDAMIDEVDRMIDKYSSSEWTVAPIAIELVDILKNHKTSLEREVVEVQTGVRVLKEDDFLGPKTRRKMRLEKLKSFAPDSDSDGEERIRVLESDDYLGLEIRRKMCLGKLKRFADEEEKIDLKEASNCDKYFQKYEEAMNKKRILRKKTAALEEEKRSKKSIK